MRGPLPALGLAVLWVAGATTGSCKRPSQQLFLDPKGLDAVSLEDAGEALNLVQKGAESLHGSAAGRGGAGAALQLGDWSVAAAAADAWMHKAAHSALEAARRGARKGAELAHTLGEEALKEADEVRTAVFVEEGHAEGVLRAVHADASLEGTAPAPPFTPAGGHLAAGAAPWGLDLTAMEPAKAPGEDFYGYVNGKWLARTQIPSDQSSWTEFSILSERAREQVHSLLEEGAKEGRLAGRLYAAFMNETRVEELGLSPLQPSLERVKAIKDARSFAAYCGATSFGFGSSPFAFGVGADPKNPGMNIGSLDQGGLGLPDRDYYLKDSFAKHKKAYGGHIARMLKLIGWPSADAAAASVLDLETQIADRSWTVEEQRDPVKTYNKLPLAELAAKAPGFEWAAFFEALGPLPQGAEIVVGPIGANASNGVPGIAALLGQTAPSALRAWAAFHLASQGAAFLPKAINDADFDFYGKTLSGQLEQKVRWKRAVSVANAYLPDAVGREYVARHFPASSKARMEELTSMLKEAFQRRVEKVSWMANATKAAALAKLANFSFEIGGPKKFRDYAGLQLDAGDLFTSVERTVRDNWEFELGKLGKPVDRDYWGMPPQVVNAFFNPTENRCYFLAAILQPPFFDPASDMAVNFGGIGAVIGHEMTHGFDDQGRQYDAQGGLRDWWSKEDAAEFGKRAEAYGQQFAAFTQGLPEGMHIKPGLTMGENIADLGGLTTSLDAYRLWLGRQKAHGAPVPPLLGQAADGLEGERRFFAGWAQVWRGKSTEASERRQLVADPHSPKQARGTIPVQNLEAWHRAFAVQPGAKLFREPGQRVEIW